MKIKLIVEDFYGVDFLKNTNSQNMPGNWILINFKRIADPLRTFSML
jgi:hypothetical protein